MKNDSCHYGEEVDTSAGNMTGSELTDGETEKEHCFHDDVP